MGWTKKLAVLALLTSACGESAEPAQDLDELEIGCGGKCDGLDSVRSLLRDPLEIELDDLVRLGAGLATDELNDALSTDSLQVRIDAANLHDEDAIGELVTGLGAAFGERELSTQVNALRLEHLESTSDEAFAEMGITLAPELAVQWGADRPGFDEDEAQHRIGFALGGEVQVGVILPVEEGDDDPLGSVKALRDFVVPRDLADIADMAPGEVFSIHGEGHLGANFGVGVPILVAQPAAAITYTVVLSAGLRTRLSGELDVQLVRLGGGEVIVDVGLSKVKSRAARVAIEDGWGVQGLLETELADVDGVAGSVDLVELVDDALTDQLDKRLNLLAAHAERTEAASRMSVARLRFDLDAADPEVASAAISQAMRGDVRLAQALSARDEPGVRVEFDLLRSGVSTTSSAGVALFGLKFFRDTVHETGSVVIQTPGGATTLLYDSLHRGRQLFSPRTGYTRVGVSGLIFDGMSAPTGQANLMMELEERDGAMQRDKLLDHLDGIILGVGGEAALSAVADVGDDLERLVRHECKDARVFDDCPLRMLEDDRVVALRADGHDAAQRATRELSESLGKLVVAAADLRLTAQATNELAGGGPGASIVSDVRLDDGALAQILSRTDGQDLQDAAEAFLLAAEVDRHLDGEARTDREASVASKSADERKAMGAHFDAIAAEYQKLLAVEEADLETIGLIGPRAVEIRFEVDNDARPIYESATARSIAQARNELAIELFDGLRERAKGLGPHAEQTVTYTLLALADAERADVRLDLDMKLSDSALHWREPYRAAEYPKDFDLHGSGDAVSRIDGGLFDVDALIAGE